MGLVWGAGGCWWFACFAFCVWITVIVVFSCGFCCFVGLGGSLDLRARLLVGCFIRLLGWARCIIVVGVLRLVFAV